MPIIVNITISTIDQAILVYDQVKVYRSFSPQSTPIEITDASTRIDLIEHVPYYSYTDTNGAIEYIYYYSLFNSNDSSESSLSEGFSGWVPSFSYSEVSFPPEKNLTHVEEDIVNSVRFYIGDVKKVKRDYVNPSSRSLYQGVSADGYTYRLSDPPGWPVKVVKDGADYTTPSDPIVNNYEYLTFLSSPISTVSGVLDVWYDKFRHSDRKILEVYTTVPYPYPLTETTTTPAIRKLQTAVTLLAEEYRELSSSVDGAFRIEGDSSFDPWPVLRAKKDDLDDLQKKLDDAIESEVLGNLQGTRLE